MKSLLTFIITLFIFLQINAQVFEEVVYLKNGSVIRGTIIEQIPNVSLKIQTKDRNVFVFNMDEVLKITKEEVPQQRNQNFNNNQSYNNSYNPYAERKSVATAVVLSAVIPGLGQYYNGDTGKGVVMNVLYVGGWVLYFTSAYDYVENFYEYGSSYSYQSWYDSYEETTDWMYVSLGVVLGTSIWSMIDAGISASNYNDQLANRNQFGHMFEYQLNSKNGVVLGVDITPTRKGVYSNFKLHF